ncbi:MAG: hypothetical protein M5U09_04600 [Gammaproteobacteria bacterium]|nr:hypothetical protein [Gammaproteobacteria bacterium]
MHEYECGGGVRFQWTSAMPSESVRATATCSGCPMKNGHDFRRRENPSSRYLRVSPGRSVDLLLEIRLSALEHAGTMHDGAIELSLAALFHEFLIDGETGVVVPVRDVGR